MAISLLDLLFLAAGLVLGAALLWLLARGPLASARQALAQATAQLATSEQQSTQLQAALREASEARTRLGERAERIPALEQKLADLEATLHEKEQALAEQREKNSGLSSLQRAQLTQLEALQGEHQALITTLASQQEELKTLGAQFAATTQALDSERAQSTEKLAVLTQARETLTHEFKTIANEILDDKSRKFTEQNQTNLGHLLNPLREQITDFRKKVEEVYVNESKDRSALAEQVTQLKLLNTTLHQDAQNLTLALKGDRKAQGNWGEIILDDVLEKAGLKEGDHYTRQNAMRAEDGSSIVIPDVVIRLPGERQIVVDSKFTLPDYRTFAEADADDTRAAALKRHLTAIRNHINGLSEKKYQTLYELQTLDFVVMFIPLEPAFMLAVTNDAELFSHAWSKNVLLVSPSTLLFVVRTIAHLWRQDALSRNAREISKRGADLYDKLVGFVEDLDKVGVALDNARRIHDEARKKLRTGRGSAIRQAEILKELGVKPTKALGSQWTAAVDDAPLELAGELSEE